MAVTVELIISKRCNRCGQIKPLVEFSPHLTSYYGRRPECKPCRMAKIKTHYQGYDEERRNQAKRIRHFIRLKYLYGITRQEYRELFSEQGGLCAICNCPETRTNNGGGIQSLSVDHAPDTGQVRGLLCANCNTGLGLMKHNTEYLYKAIRYLKGGK